MAKSHVKYEKVGFGHKITLNQQFCMNIFFEIIYSSMAIIYSHK